MKERWHIVLKPLRNQAAAAMSGSLQSLLIDSNLVQAQLAGFLSKMARSDLVACMTIASLTKASAMLLEARHGVRWHDQKGFCKYSSKPGTLSLL